MNTTPPPAALSALSEYQAEVKRLFFKIDDCLRRAHLPYVVAYGTLIGTLRHQAMIPWDDDIDLIVERKDFRRIMETLNRECPDLYAWDWELDPACTLQYGRVFNRLRPDTSPAAYRAFVDIFIADHAPAGRFWQLFSRAMTTAIRRLMGRKGHYPKYYRSSSLTNIVLYLMALPFTFCSQATLLKLYHRLCDWPKDSPLGHIDRAIRPYAMGVWQGDLAPFEGRQVPIPKDADAILQNVYGDWRTPPPENARFGHAYYTEDGQDYVDKPADRLRQG